MGRGCDQRGYAVAGNRYDRVTAGHVEKSGFTFVYRFGRIIRKNKLEGVRLAFTLKTDEANYPRLATDTFFADYETGISAG